MKKNDVFISYVIEDTEQASRLETDLENQGVSVWRDVKKISPGARWKNDILKAISSGSFFIACFSNSYWSKEASYMNLELIEAIEQIRLRHSDKIWFIPILFEECAVPALPIGGGATLLDFQWISLFDDWDRGISRLVDVINPSDLVKSRKHLRSLAHSIIQEKILVDDMAYGVGIVDDDVTDGLNGLRTAYKSAKNDHLIRFGEDYDPEFIVTDY